MKKPVREEIKRIKLSTPAVEGRRSPTANAPTPAQEPKRSLFLRFRSLVDQTLNGERSAKKPEATESSQPSDNDYAKIARSLGHDDLPFEPGDDDADNHPSSRSMKP